MKDYEFKNEYEKLKPRYELISEVIKERKDLNLIREKKFIVSKNINN